jgi:DhnA family fructose-bisphosphate aldolase class Ia
MEKKLRLRRLKNEKTGRILLLPLDHGISIGPVPGIENLGRLLKTLKTSKVNGFIMHKGAILRCGHLIGNHQSIVLHLNASSDLSAACDLKIMVADLEDAIRVGADGVSVHVNFGALNDSRMLGDLGKISSDCLKSGMPLLVMAYARGNHLNERSIKNILKTIRIAMEIGADIVKVPVPENSGDLSVITRTAEIPVILAGGEKCASIAEVFKTAYAFIHQGGAGFAIGRNCFQSRDPVGFINGLNSIVNENATVIEALTMTRCHELVAI